MPEQPSTLECITLETGPSPDAAIIWLHGLGADAHDFVPLVEQLQLPSDAAIRFVFPHAPIRPVSLNQGQAMRAWYDLYGLTFDARDDEQGIKTSSESIRQLCQQQQALGIESRRIIIAGFSQGGAIALHCGLRYPEKLGGIIALSTYLCLKSSLNTEMSAFATQTSVFMAHGQQDETVLYEYGQQSMQILKTAGIPLTWHTYIMGHSVSTEEICDLRSWILQTLTLPSLHSYT